MKLKTTFIYTDASYSKLHNVAVIGHLKLRGTNPQILTKDLTQEINLETIPEKNNVRAELQAALKGLESCDKKENIVLFSDSRAVTDLPQRKEKLEKENFISKKTNSILNNADLYKRLYSIIDQLNLEIIWVKGHSPNKDSDPVQSNFSYLDKKVRRELRSRLQKIESK